MAEHLLSGSSFVDPLRKQRVLQTSLQSLEMQEEQAVQRAVQTLSLARSGDVSPETATRGQVLSDTILSSPTFRLLDPKIMDTIEARVKGQRELQLLRDNPRTAAYVANYDNALSAADDVETLGNLESGWNAIAKGSARIRDNYITGRARDTLLDLLQSAEDASKSYAELLEETRTVVEGEVEVGGETSEFTADLSGPGRVVWRWLKSRSLLDETALEARREGLRDELTDVLMERNDLANVREANYPTQAVWRTRLENRLAEIKEDKATNTGVAFLSLMKENPLRSAQYLAEVAAESGIGVAAGILMTAVTRNPAMGALIMGGTSANIAGEAFFDEMLTEHGYDISTPEGIKAFIADPDIVMDKAMAYGLVVGLMDGASGGLASKMLVNNPVGNMVLQTIAQGIMGGSGELLGRIAADEEIDWVDVYIEALAEMVTAPLEVIGMSVANVKGRINAATEARQRRTLFQVLSGQAAASNLRGRDKARFAAAANEVLKNGPAENLYVDPEKLTQLFQSAGKMSVEDFIETIPELDIEVFRQAMDTGSQFVIPTGVYAARIAGTDFDAMLQEHVRFRDVNSMTAAEGKTFMEDLKKAKEDVEGSIDKASDIIEEFEGPLQEAFERMTSEIVEAQGITRAAASKQARVFAEVNRAGAQRTGMPMAEYLQRYAGMPGTRSAEDVGPAPRRTIDVAATLEAVQSSVYAPSTPDIVAIRELLDDSGIDPENASQADIIDAVKELLASGRIAGMLPEAERVVHTVGSPTDEPMAQSATLRDGTENREQWGLMKGTRIKVRELALKLQARQRKLYGKTNRKQRGQKTVEKFGGWMADEIMFELQTPGAAAAGWYTVKFQRALDQIAAVFPEMRGMKSNQPGLGIVKTAEDARAIFTVFLAITSNGAKVVQNFQMAVELYSAFRETGSLEAITTLGDRGAAVEIALKRYAALLERFDTVAEATAYLLEEITVSEANAELRAMGETVLDGMPAAMRVPRAATIIGPKIGAFFANLSGSTGYLTMDMWWTRTINRYRGDVLPRVSGLKNAVDGQGKPLGLYRFKLMINRPDLTDSQALNYVTEYAQRYRDKKYKNGTEAEAAANTIYKDAFVRLAEQPEGPADRAFMLEVARAAQAEVFRRTDVMYSIADIQALIWYYEKRLYADMGTRDSGDVSYEEAAATAVETHLRESTFSQSAVPGGIKVDNPGGEWLAGKQADAEKAMAGPAGSVLRSSRAKGLTGATTGWTDGAVMLPTSMLADIPGASGENRAPGDPKYDQLDRLVKNYGFLEHQDGNAVLVGVNHKGEAFLLEGNTRVAVATAHGVETIRTEVRWFNGGETADGTMTPAIVEAAISSEAETFFQSTAGSATRLPGLERASPGRVLGVRELASRYMAAQGLPVRHQADYAFVNEPRATEIAQLYDAMEHAPNDPEVKAAYEALAEETIAQFEALQELGMTFEWITGADPYASPADAIRDMQENNHLWVFPTDSGFGTLSEAENDNPLLAMSGHTVAGKETRVNDIFRIVHDVFGHGSEGASFGARGEENAWQAHVRMFSPLAARAMTTETRGQNSWVNYGPHGEANRRDPKNTVFADQKTGLLPEWVSEVGQTADVTAKLDDFQVADIEDLNYDAFRKPGWFIAAAKIDAEGDATSAGNLARADAMRAQIEGLGLEYLELEGVYDSKSDGTSFLVIGSREAAISAGMSFEQESVLTNEGFIYTDGSDKAPVPFDGMITGWDAKNEMFYSRFKDGHPNALFSLNMQFPSPQDVAYDPKDNPDHHHGAVVTDGKIEMVHWSPQPQTKIDPAKAGTGEVRGPERLRGGPLKAFFGINQGTPTGYKRESYSLGRNKHVVRIDPLKMYPYNRDPDKLLDTIDRTLSDTAQIGAYEQAIKDAGYLGYIAIEGPLGDAAVTFYPMDVDTIVEDNDAPRVKSPEFKAWFKKSAATNADGSPKMVYHGTDEASLFAYFMGGSWFSEHPGEASAYSNLYDMVRRARALGKFEVRQGAAALAGKQLPYNGTLSDFVDPEQGFVAATDGGVYKYRGGGKWFVYGDVVVDYTTFDPASDTIGVVEGDAGAAAALVVDEFDAYVRERFPGGQAPRVIPAYLSIQNPLRLSAFDANRLSQRLSTDYAGVQKQLAEYAAQGYDGIVTESDEALSSAEVRSDLGGVPVQWIVFKPGQVKSPFNRGTWSANDPDILYQSAPTPATPAPATPAFKKWFGGSMVVDANGSPLVVYHSTSADFDRFRRRRGDIGIHFGTSGQANDRAAYKQSRGGVALDGQNVIPVYLSISNPLRLDDLGAWDAENIGSALGSVSGFRPEDLRGKTLSQLRGMIEAAGYDGIVYRNTGEVAGYAERIAKTDALRKAVWAKLGLRNSVSVEQQKDPDYRAYRAAYDADVRWAEENAEDSFIAFKTTQIKSVFNKGTFDPANPDILNQGKEGDRAYIILPPSVGEQAMITVFKQADLSSILHEGGHLFLWQLQQQARDGIPSSAEMLGTVTGWWKRNAAAIATEASAATGVKIDTAQVMEYLEVGTTGLGDIDKAVHRALHEQFARGFELYLREGKSPSNEMRSTFEALAAWLVAIYKSAKQLRVNIDDDIRSVFDRMIATEKQIAEGAARAGIDNVVAETSRDMGLDEEAYRKLVVLSEEARDEARQRVRAELARASRMMHENAYAERLAAIEAEEREAVNTKPVNRAIQWLAYGRWLGEGRPDNMPPELRFDTALLIEEHGQEILDKLPRGRRPTHMKDTGLSADDVAGWFGYSSGAELLQDMTQVPKANDEIKARTKQRALEELGDISADPEAVEAEVEAAFHGEKRGQVIVAEMRAINRIGGGKGRVTSRAVATRIARDMIRKMTVRDAIRSEQYSAAERRHAEQAARLLAEGKIEEAFEVKRKQLIQHALYIESKKADELVGKAERLAGRLKRKGTRENLAGEYLGAIDDILETYSFRKVSGKAELRREALVAYVDGMKAQGRENELAIPDSVLLAAKAVPYKTLSVQRLQGVYDSLVNIEHTARFKQKLRDAKEARDRAEVVAEISAAIDASVGRVEMNRVATRTDRIMSGVKGYFNLARNADTILRRFDNWQNRGVVYRFFKDRIDTAGSEAVKMREQVTKDLQSKKLFGRFDRKTRERMSARKMWKGYGQALSRWDIISIALNMGNKDNLERMTSRDSRDSLTRQEVDALVDNLTVEEVDFVQAVWSYLDDEVWPQVKAREERVTGVAPTKVEALEWNTKFGPRKGGYYPIAYDRRYTASVGEDRNAELIQSMMAGRFGKAQTRNGHLQDRGKGGGGRTLELGMHVMFSHLNHVTHDLAYSEAVSATWGLLQDKNIKMAFERAGRLEDHMALELWVQDVASGVTVGTHVLAGTMRRLKTGFSVSKLAFNMSTVAIQVTGATQSVALIGAGNVTVGYAQYIGSMGTLASSVWERSPFMQERQRTFNRDVLDIINDTQMDPMRSRLSDASWLVTQAGLWAMQKVQYYAVDVPTWLGAHHQGLAQGMDDASAVLHADRMVARAQSSGLYADRTPIERGTMGRNHRQNDFLRLFTALASYMFTKYNVANEVLGRAARDIKDPDRSSVVAILKGMTDMLLLFTVEALLYNAIKGRLPGQDEDEDDDESWIKFIAQETALSVFSVFPFIRDASSAVQGYGGGGTYGSVSETFGRAINSAGDLLAGEANSGDLRAAGDLIGLTVPGYPSTALWRIIDGAGLTGKEPSLKAAILGR